MAIVRHFLGFRRPALEHASELIMGRAAPGPCCDLERMVIVVPGARAGRNLRRQLLTTAARLQRGLLPPQIVTVSHLPELLYPPKRPFAMPVVQQLAWTRALYNADPVVRDQIVPRRNSPDDTTDGNATDQLFSQDWLDLGRMLWRQYRELTEEGLSFADVAERGSTLDGFSEAARWRALATVQTEYLRALDEEQVWDKPTARLVAVRHQECHFDGEIILLSTVDLSRTVRQMLDQLGDRVTALIHAPEEWAARFDPYGCIEPEAWQQVPIEMDDDKWWVCHGPQEQGDRIAAILKRYDGLHTPDEVVIGCTDESLIPFVQRSVSQQGVALRWSAGVPVERTGPIRLLALLADLLDERRFQRFAQWVRHPDVIAWLGTRGIYSGFLRYLDEYYKKFLPATWTEPFRGSGSGDSPVQKAIEQTRRLVEPLSGGTRPLIEWLDPLRQVLREIYQSQTADRRQEVGSVQIEGCQAIDDALADLATLPRRLAMNVSAPVAIRMVIRVVAGQRVPLPVGEDEIELLGWLELPLDEAPDLIITGFNEGLVPQSVTSDLFLPDRLRRHLGIDDNLRRYARDAYALSALLSSRRSVDLITCQNNVHGDPLLPSRLLFCCDDATRAARWLRFSEAVESAAHSPSSAIRPEGSEDRPLVPMYKPTPPRDDVPLPSAWNVTAFKRYMECPYLFFLERVLRLEFVDDDLRELDASTFGTLIHDALRRFGSSPQKDCTDPTDIYHAVAQELRQLVSSMFGDHPLPTVSVQEQQALRRLEAFAKEQAKCREEGWRIDRVESEERVEVVWDVDGQPVTIRGKIDRIDVNERTGHYRVIDYKTGETSVHVKGLRDEQGNWTDLQLPLYRHLARQYGIDGPVEAAYFVLPKKLALTALHVVDWDEESLQRADEQARSIIRSLRQRKFWPPADPPPKYSDPWHDICGVE